MYENAGNEGEGISPSVLPISRPGVSSTSEGKSTSSNGSGGLGDVQVPRDPFRDEKNDFYDIEDIPGRRDVEDGEPSIMATVLTTRRKRHGATLSPTEMLHDKLGSEDNNSVSESYASLMRSWEETASVATVLAEELLIRTAVATFPTETLSHLQIYENYSHDEPTGAVLRVVSDDGSILIYGNADEWNDLPQSKEMNELAEEIYDLSPDCFVYDPEDDVRMHTIPVERTFRTKHMDTVM